MWYISNEVQDHALPPLKPNLLMKAMWAKKVEEIEETFSARVHDFHNKILTE